MARMRLPDGSETVFDDCDEALLAGYRWRILNLGRLQYVHAWRKYQHLYMHRLIMGAPKGRHVDHVNGNGLDNRRANLRLATPSQNHANRGPDHRVVGKSSRYKGVYYVKRRGKWAATIHVNGKTRGLGQTFLTEQEAAAAYDAAALAIWGEFAKINGVSVPVVEPPHPQHGV